MPAIPPSPTQQITVGDVATTLGNASKNMGGFRGFGGVIPDTGPISMSACQKIQYGVGYYNSWFQALSSVTQGTWGDTSITKNANMTYSIWVTTNNINDPNFRPLLDVAPSGTFTDGLSTRRPALFIFQNSDKFHVVADCSGNNPNQGIYQTTTGIPLNTKTNIIVVYNGSTVTAYVNGTAAGSNQNLPGTPTAALTTDEVTSPVVNSTYSSFGNFALNYLWFFPYAMNATQVSTYYTTTNALVPNFLFAYASGGTITNSGSYTIHTFSASGTFTMLAARAVSVVVVGGGNSGASGTTSTGGSGGAGGGVSIITNASLSIGNSVTVTVGATGATSTISGSMSVSATGGGGANGGIVALQAAGDGTTVSVAGTNIVYGGGGGGGNGVGGQGTSGGAGGGGAGGDSGRLVDILGSTFEAPPTNGSDGSNGLGGGGGGGGGGNGSANGAGPGSGGSGVVVFWYLS